MPGIKEHHKTAWNVFLFVLTASIVLSCAQSEPDAEIRLQRSDDVILKLSIPDGGKWTVDVHTDSMFYLMRQYISEAEPDNIRDWQETGKQLGKYIDDLIKGCTMQGEPHARLHVFLNYYIPLVDQLIEAPDESVSRTLFAEIKYSIRIYDQYFELSSQKNKNSARQ